MSVILKHIWRNVKDKKVISALIVISLMISGALLFVALSISDMLDDAAGSEYQSVTTTFMLIFIATSFMSVFIVYSSFKYIVTMRIKTIGTLRSVGADKRRCKRMLLWESAAYGLIASVFGLACGIALLAILGGSLSGGSAALKISPLYLSAAAVFCIVSSCLCAYFPIKAAERYSVKEIILQTREVKEKRRLPALITGLILSVAGAALLLIKTLKYEEWPVYCALIFMLAGFVLCAGPLIRYLTVMLEKIFPNSLTVKMMGQSRSRGNIAVLLAIAAAVVFMINSSNALLIGATDKSFTLYNYDIQIGTKNYDALYDESAVAGVLELTGVTGADGIYFKAGAEAGGNIPIMNLYGMTSEKMDKHFNFTIAEDIAAIAPKTILLSGDYLERERLAKGGAVTLEGVRFEIAGVFKEMLNSGNVGVISESDFKELYGIDKYSLIVAESSLPDASRDALRAAGLPAATVADMLSGVKSINADMFAMINYIIVLSTTAGVFGVLNNLLIALAAQKRERALLRSIGMSQKKSAGCILIEAVITGLTGGLLGLAGGLLMTPVIPAVFSVYEFPAVPAPLSPAAAALCVLCPAAICLFASLISLIGNSKLNIVQTLREEIL